LVALGSAPELKSVFADRPIFEVQSPRPVDAMAALEQLPEIEKTSIFGTTVHAVVGRAGVPPSQVQAALEAKGIPVTAVSPVPPSLEDVFLDVVERREQGEGGGQAA